MIRRRPAVLLLPLLVASAVALSAHLAVVKTLPADGATLAEPPARVEIWFSQQPSARVSRLDLRGPDGEVPLGALEVHSDERSISAAIQGSLEPGAYEVSWRTAGDDGHVQRGTFGFSLRTAD